jgi:beta-lactamase regulating signal transducer with metallopeptidase domain
MNSLHSLETALALTLLHSLWQVALLSLIASFVLAALDRCSAAVRHDVGILILLAMAAAPLVTFCYVSASPAIATPGGVSSQWPANFSVLTAFKNDATAFATPLWLPWAWIAGVGFMLSRLIGGWWVVRLLSKKTMQPLAPHWQARVQMLCARMGIRREVCVRLADDIGAPFAAWIWRPIIWMPLSMFTRLPADQLEALIAHELAHIRRLDWIWNGLQRAVEALLFFHPGMWWLSGRVRQEREHACDDFAVAACSDPIVLAEALAMCEKLRSSRHLFVLSANGGVLMQRIMRLLSAKAPARSRWAAPAGLVAVLSAGALLATEVNPNVPEPGTTAPRVVSGSWWSRVGNSFEVRQHAAGDERVYSQWIDLSGHVHERYTVNGKNTSIDAAAAQWIAVRMAQAEHIPAPSPIPPMPAIPPIPAPPSIADSAPFQAAMQVARSDSKLIELLGSPMSATVNGPNHVHDDASAELSIALSGPKGKATLRAFARLDGATWRFPQWDVAPDHGGAHSNTAAE